MSRSNILLIVALLIALVGWFRYFQEHSSGIAMQSDFSALKERSALSEEQVEARQTEVDTLNRQHETLRSQVDELMQELQATSGETGTLTMTASTSVQGDTLQAAVYSAEAEIQALKAQNENLKSLLTQEPGDVNTVSEQLTAGREEVNDLAQQLAQEISARDQLEAALMQAKNKAEQTTALEQQLQAADQEISAHTTSLANERARIEAFEQKLTVLNQGREMLESDISAKQSQLSQLTQEQERAREQIELLKREIEQVTKQTELEVKNLQDQVTLIRMGSDIVYELGSTDLKQSGQKVLDRVAEFAKRMPDRIVSLEGHTDDIPIAESRKALFASNWELSAARAASAARYLEGLGVESRRLRIVGYGPNQPVSQNDSEQGRRSNRRLEIRLAPEKVFEAAAE